MKYLTRQEELILLTVFQLKNNAYLVTIRNHLKQNTKKSWSVGAVYVPLDRLKQRGYLKTRIGEPAAKRGRNAVKYYHLTQDGIKALAEIKKVNDLLWAGFSTESISTPKNV
ncbi:MAG: helix-turn-helix transcriptional regulator [Candidatus Aminicenantes bacterium]|nr:helix-turn-helix transcriptional regulator [Candidatus Aminicenantes bacterium]